MTSNQWQFWIDRGGTFTDIVACDPKGEIHTHKLLSENAQQYKDAAIQGVRDLLSLNVDQPIPVNKIQGVRMGTTVATNALLEHAGEPLLLLVTQGFKDALQIAYQQRPDLFALDIQLPEMLYSEVVEINERIKADGEVLKALDEKSARIALQTAWNKGLRSIAIVLMHGYRYSQHEQQLAEIAVEIGFPQISVSHQVSPLIRYISRGDTTVVDAYLSPVLRRYVDQVAMELPDIPLLFMQSSGGLTQADYFQGKDAILSGPAGGVVGMIQTAQAVGFDRLIGFDMGGTSTDVCHYQGDYERTMETQIAGVRINAPMMRIHTVAAGGGSVLHYDQHRFQVGPDSAGANPGPAAYRGGGALTITDCNVLLGKLQPDFFPFLFGVNADQPLDKQTVQQQFYTLAKHSDQSAEQMAEGFLMIAVENMANAIKKISVQRGYDVTQYTLCCFGGAGGQHACLVADALGIDQIFLHEYSGVLSAYGMGLADIRKIHRCSLDVALSHANESSIQQALEVLKKQVKEDLSQQCDQPVIHFHYILHCQYEGSDSKLEVIYSNQEMAFLQSDFMARHEQQFGFIYPDKVIVVASVEVEGVIDEPTVQRMIDGSQQQSNQSRHEKPSVITAITTKPIYMQGEWREVPFYQRGQLPLGVMIKGPAIILEETGTLVVEPGWSAELLQTPFQTLLKSSQGYQNNLVLTRHEQRHQPSAIGTKVDPVMLEVFNNLFMSIAEQMGFVLEKTAVSVNIKERLDFSCAIFDPKGNLVANAPHMPVHLGSMSESIKAVINKNRGEMNAGDVFVLNDPYNGGTHLPDITVIRPVFSQEIGCDDEGSHEKDTIVFYVASRGHHADIGGISPGSIPPNSQSVIEEGILINNFKLVKAGVFQEQAMRELLTSTGSNSASDQQPVRNIDYNIADLKAQLAACEKGTIELSKIIGQYGLSVVQAYMSYVQDNAEESVRRVLGQLNNGEFSYQMDDGSQIAVNIRVDKQQRTACIDFTGTSQQHTGNLNAPTAITRAAVLYVFRTLVDENIPLNEGCLKPLQIIIPENCLLNPRYPAAVVAGNVETSQYIVDTLYGALGVMGASQGTMNNVTWGNDQYQYYETLCGGAGATPFADGADAVHTHMTNSRLTDPEVLEQRFPVILDEFSIRKNSGGMGKYRGGDGVVRKTRFLQPMTVNILSGHRIVAPYGMAEGGAGLVGENSIGRNDLPLDASHLDVKIEGKGKNRDEGMGKEEPLLYKAQIEVEKGDVLVIKTPGGGGYGASL